MQITVGHSGTLILEEDIATAALGNPNIAQTVVVKPNTLLINASSTGATSLTLFGKSGHIYDYRLLVSHDLSLLRGHLKKLDSRIQVETDPNGNAVVLSGIAKSKEIIERAVEAAIRFFGESSVTMSNQLTARALNDPTNLTTTHAKNSTGNVTTNSSASHRETLRSAETRIINLITTDEGMMPAAARMQNLLQTVDKRISVEQANNAFVLKGNVATPAALSRALAMADRFISQDLKIDINVISDQGGVLAGELSEERDEGIETVDPVLSVQRAGGSSGRGGSGGRSGGAGAGLRQPLHFDKGNLAQNISRGDVITAAGGRVMSLLQIDDQPRIEMQMRIVAVDRNKTDELGIDWRLDGSKVSIGSKTGGVVDVLPSPNSLINGTGTIDSGSANLVGFFFPGSYAIQAFLRAIEDKGAANTLSEPLLTAVSGESTSFLVGGSIPVPSQTLTPGNATSNAVATTNVVYLDYGLKLIVRPTVLENGKIAIVLDQSISEPDYGKQIKLLGEPIPAFIQKTVSTVTEAEDGETWAVAGLITEEVSKKLREVPFISKIPVLGALFRNKTDKNSRTELMITVTARRVGAKPGAETARQMPKDPLGSAPQTIGKGAS